MKIFVTHIGHILRQRLESKGVDKTKLPGILRELSNFDLVDPRVNISYINERMRYLGWGDFKLDYQTLQLAIACFEAGGAVSLTYDEEITSLCHRTLD